MNAPEETLSRIRAINATAAFNRYYGFEVVSASAGEAELAMSWRDEAGQYAGYLHAGLIGALIDTACGFAAATLIGRSLAAHFSVRCLRPAVGERFVARAKVVKPGKTLVFTRCELYAQKDDGEKLVATGETLLAVEAGYTIFTDWRRRGYAGEMMTGFIAWAKSQGVAGLVLSIAPGNIASRALAARFGARQIGSQIDEIDGPEDIFFVRFQQ